MVSKNTVLSRTHVHACHFSWQIICGLSDIIQDMLDREGLILQLRLVVSTTSATVVAHNPLESIATHFLITHMHVHTSDYICG